MKYSTRVADIYDGGEILITGATGFLGKILLDKLLRYFEKINTIYIIVRDKKGVNPEERINKMFEDILFEKLRTEVPGFKSKIHVLKGNIQEENIGLSPEDTKLIISKVNIVFHCAATLRFDEELKSAIITNIVATQRMLTLAKLCPNLKMFTYVSTAFSNATRIDIGEEIYTPLTHYKQLIEVSKLDEKSYAYQNAKRKLAKESVNTYTLTKAAAEQLLEEEAQGFPVAIFRPSIVICTWKEPIPGWIDNLYGPTGLVTGAQAGAIRSFYYDPQKKADMVPVDLVVNSLVCVPWHSQNLQTIDTNSLPIYNYVSSIDNPITWTEFSRKIYNVGVQNPSSQVLWYYFYFETRHKWLHVIRSLFLHYLFGYIFDFCFWMAGNKLRLVPIYQKMDKVVDVLEPFCTREWKFTNQNIRTMWVDLDPEDKKKFPFNIEHLNWTDYIGAYVKGTLIFHLQDKLDLETRKKAMRRYKRLSILHHCIKGLLLVLLMLFVWSLIRFKFGHLLS